MNFLFRLVAFATLSAALHAQDAGLSSGQASLQLRQDPENRSYALTFTIGGKVLNTYAPDKPLSLDVNGERLDGGYAKVSQEKNDTLVCQGVITTPHGTRFLFTDRYLVEQPGAFELRRSIVIQNANRADQFFNSLFGIQVTENGPLEDSEFFVPGVWYRTNFKTRMAGALAKNPADHHFLFREDRLPLPLVTMRDPGNGDTVSLIHAAAEPATFTGDRGGERVVDERMQFGSIGVRHLDGTTLAFMFPGSEGEKNHVVRRASDGWALRSHPVKEGVQHHYKLVIRFSKTASYPDAVETTWKHAFQLYQPKPRPVDVKAAFTGLIDTLDHYSVGKGYDAPGFPFSVYLPGGDVRVYNYQMGFVGRQLPNAYFLIHQGIAEKRADLRRKGVEIVDFWAENCLLPSGLPRTWYDPATAEGTTGSWRKNDNPKGGTAMRVATTGMEGMLSAWRLMERHGTGQPGWLAACGKFGDWLVANQNDDGSYHLAYSHELTDGKHLPTEPGKSTTTNPIRFLVMLHQATGDARYRDAAIRAGKFALTNIHQPYHYVGSVVDNPNVIDRESGQEAIYAFLALYDLTQEKSWLDAAVQAARYTETWMYAYEIPAETGAAATDFPQDRSIVGQTLIATGQSAADLGLAFSSFDYYRLHLFTGDPHFLEIAKLLVHNTKQSLNWDGSLYPGKPKGLQLEAFTVTIPRRKGVMECLSWNYAAHLDPLVRFQDAFGSMDIEAIEKLPMWKRREINQSILRNTHPF
ncbi:hypothetical protein JIN84_03680 [Luteolibacter yonseiensis]|uniref:Cellulase Ig-like domain-containing protein n=1 Tax=Luteolibacter yonseiensis TaxID=1144680 RepID=A0A934QXT9_9BACT|nr:hypothetical protein [Luteolibacter yonseiensis]MBK1814698.1 hypothetical protein [Luteolibacter yonseiensis]